MYVQNVSNVSQMFTFILVENDSIVTGIKFTFACTYIVSNVHFYFSEKRLYCLEYKVQFIYLKIKHDCLVTGIKSFIICR